MAQTELCGQGHCCGGKKSNDCHKSSLFYRKLLRNFSKLNCRTLWNKLWMEASSHIKETNQHCFDIWFHFNFDVWVFWGEANLKSSTRLIVALFQGRNQSTMIRHPWWHWGKIWIISELFFQSTACFQTTLFLLCSQQSKQKFGSHSSHPQIFLKNFLNRNSSHSRQAEDTEDIVFSANFSKQEAKL